MKLLNYLPLLLQGTSITLAAWLIAGLISLLIGTLLAIASCRNVGNVWWQRIIFGYTFIAKGVPAYVQILIAYFVIPAACGIAVPGFVAAVGALIFCSTGYITEIVRSGLNSLPQGQWDACFVLGYPLSATLQRIILPQTLSNSMAALLGELEQLLKSSSLLATIGVTELTRVGANIISREMNPMSMYLIIACIYLVFAACLQYVRVLIERKGWYACRY